jgi:hypothetical protein
LTYFYYCFVRFLKEGRGVSMNDTIVFISTVLGVGASVILYLFIKRADYLYKQKLKEQGIEVQENCGSS